MNILISGGSGFLGRAFSQFIHEQNCMDSQITWLSRDTQQAHPDFITMMSYDSLATTDATFDVIVNLAGAGIADKRWSGERKALLMTSRLQPTQSIINYIAKISRKPKLLLSGSAIGWYGPQGDTPLDENNGYIDDFSHQLCEAWEQEASKAIALGVPVAIVRTGIVIHPDGGMIAKLLPPFKSGVGGKLGNGQQIMSWISREDWVGAAWFIINNAIHVSSTISNSSTNSLANNSSNTSANRDTDPKVYNLTAPNPIRNTEFTKTLGKWLNRPVFMSLPEWFLKLAFGEMSTLLIDGQRVLPVALLNSGFEFQHHSLEQALENQR